MMARKILMENATENNTTILFLEKKLLVTVHALTLYITRIKNKVLK